MSWSKTLLFFIVVIVSGSITPSSSDGPLYKQVGDTAVLSPGVVTNPITNIFWKHGSSIAVEWTSNNIESYGQFRGRGSVNSLSGELTITGLTKEDSGSYTSEINFSVTSEIELQVIAPVSTPNVSTRCDKEKTHCVFTCEGGTSEAEPITYTWKSGDMHWDGTKEHSITKTEKEPWFSCTLHNPISNKSSEEVENPFISSDWNLLYLWFIPAVVLLLMIACIIFFVMRKRRRGNLLVMGNGQVYSSQDHGNQDLPLVAFSNANSVTGTSQKMENGQGIPNQDQPVHNQVPADPGNQAASHELNNVTETTPMMQESQEAPNQVQLVDNPAAAPHDDQGITTQDPTLVVSDNADNDMKTTPKMETSQEALDQDQLVNNQVPADPGNQAVSHELNNVTETTPKMQTSQEALDQDQLVDSPAAAPHDEQGITTQDPTLVVSDYANNDMKSALLMSSGQEPSNQDPPVDNQEAEPQEQEQS
ncbi:uncharacterized protein LOC121178173 isoform X2 [Toxotes jaculatrix]|uniref:uncharacterized protein LOC121178173 isoform X2 n=1 Tax=Toxotes jaculatrix TaxID=941984 RepID=UPI001B3A7EDB|nr:uncharacterized protein LOC121178173 isoform X2 [Toxotes jaculatrix]